MAANAVHKEIGAHKSTIIALYMEYVTPTELLVVTLDEDGIIQIHKPDGSLVALINLAK